MAGSGWEGRGGGCQNASRIRRAIPSSPSQPWRPRTSLKLRRLLALPGKRPYSVLGARACCFASCWDRTRPSPALRRLILTASGLSGLGQSTPEGLAWLGRAPLPVNSEFVANCSFHRWSLPYLLSPGSGRSFATFLPELKTHSLPLASGRLVS